MSGSHEYSGLDASEKSLVGTTGVTVTRFGFGTAPLAGLYEAVDDAQAAAALQEALDAGVGYFDTAPHYGSGLAEQRLGSVIRRASETPALSTKIGYSFRSTSQADGLFVGVPQLEAYVDWSQAGLERSLELSLERLGVSRIDVLYLHDPMNGEFDDLVRVGASVARRWQDEGLIGAVGAGMNYTDDALALLDRVELDCLLIAGRVSLLDQTATEALLPLCDQRGTAVIVGGVFNSGILARPDASARFDYMEAAPDLVERARTIDGVCNGYGVPLAAAALQFPFRYAPVVSVIPGMRSANEVIDNLRLFSHEIPAALWVDLELAGLIPPLEA